MHQSLCDDMRDVMTRVRAYARLYLIGKLSLPGEPALVADVWPVFAGIFEPTLAAQRRT